MGQAGHRGGSEGHLSGSGGHLNGSGGSSEWVRGVIGVGQAGHLGG